MKYKGNVIGAVVSLALFLAFAIAGGICLATGFAELAANSDAINNLHDIVEYVDDFSLNVNVGGSTEKATATYARELNDEVESIVIATGGCSVNVRNGSEFSVEFSGNVGQGKFDNLNESDYPKAVETEDSAAYYDHSGIINASFENGVLNVNIDSAINVQGVNFNIGADLGRITVYIPADYTGGLELKDSFAEISVAGLDFSELTLTNCLGETDINKCNIGMLTVTNMAGELNAEGGMIGGVQISNIAGEVDVDTISAFTVDSMISDIAGEVNIDLPVGTQLNVNREDVLGEIRIDRDIVGSTEAPFLEISDILGEVSIEIDD